MTAREDRRLCRGDHSLPQDEDAGGNMSVERTQTRWGRVPGCCAPSARGHTCYKPVPIPGDGACQSSHAKPVPGVAECPTRARVSPRLSHSTARPQLHPKTLEEHGRGQAPLHFSKEEEPQDTRGRSRVPSQDPSAGRAGRPGLSVSSVFSSVCQNGYDCLVQESDEDQTCRGN